MSLENASCGSEHKCFGALDAPFIGYQHNAVLITCLYVSDYKIVGRVLKWAQCNARGGAHDPGEQVYIHNFYRQWFYFIAIGGSVKYFLFRYGGLAKIIIILPSLLYLFISVITPSNTLK